jgi:hypothetical protein
MAWRDYRLGVSDTDNGDPEEVDLPKWADKTIEVLALGTVVVGIVAVVVLAVVGLVVVVRAML